MDPQNEQPIPDIGQENISILNAQTQSDEDRGNLPSRFSKKILLIIVGIFLILSLCAGLLFALNNRNSNPSESSSETEDTLLATVGDRSIFKSNVAELALRYITKDALDNETLKEYYKLAIERAILDNEIKRLNIRVDDSKVQEELGKLSINQESPNYIRNRDEIYYRLLKEELEKTFISSITFYRVSYWIPAASDPEANYENYKKEKNAGEAAISDVYKKVQAGQDPYIAAIESYNAYSDIQNRFAFNGYIMKGIIGKQGFNGPKEIDFSKVRYTGEYFFNDVRAMEAGDVRLIKDPNDRGMAVVKLVSMKKREFESLEELIAKRMMEIVRIINTI